MNPWLILPILFPFIMAGGALLFFRWRSVQAACGVLGPAGVLMAGGCLLKEVHSHGIQAAPIAGWPAPYGITLVADLLSAILVIVAGVIGLAVALAAFASVDRERKAFHFFPMANLLLTGVCGAFLAGDIFNLYVWFELMLISSFVLLSLGNEPAQVRGALVYVSINLFSSALFLASVGILYGLTGTLNLADLALKLPHTANQALTGSVSMLLLVAFGIKAAVVPFFFWLPPAYSAPPPAVSALFSGLLTEVGIYGLLRTFTLLFPLEEGWIQYLLIALAGITMLVGCLGALAQQQLPLLLTYVLISHVGIMLLGLALFTPLALAALLFYILHHSLAQANLFLLSGLAARLCGTSELRRMGGLSVNRRALAFLFVVPALALAAFPPLSGFFPTIGLLRAGFTTHHYGAMSALLLTDLVTLFLMARVWMHLFWGLPSNAPAPRPQEKTRLIAAQVPITLLACLTGGISALAGPLFALCTRAASQLLDPAQYIQAVLGDQP